MSGSFSRSQTTRKPGVTASSGGVVAAQHVIAARAGADVLAAGGDAVDAAVAVSFVIGVLEPWMSGPFGGGAMMLWRADEGKAEALNYGMRSSRKLDVGFYPLVGRGKASDLFPWAQVFDDRNVKGATAVAVPGVVDGLAKAHARHGRMPWAELLTPAIEAARRGLHVDWYAALIISSACRELSEDRDAAALFLEDGQWPRGSGWTALSDERLDQSRHADTLQHLAMAGPRELYDGDIGESFVKDVTAKGGFMSREDLTGYEAEWQDPLEIPFRDGRLWAVPKMTAGPTLADAIAHWQKGYPQHRAGEPEAYAARAEGLDQAYRTRLEGMGDNESPKAPGCTTHFSIVDRQGNMVAMTQTLLSLFGSRCVSPSTGMLMNNGIMWFDPEPGRPNSLAPAKKCLMNVCPVVGEGQGGQRRFALGASGGRKIMPAVAQIAAGLIEQGQSMAEAIEAPRIDVSGGDLCIADERLAGPALAALSGVMQTATAKRLPFPYAFACPAGVMREGDRNSGTTETFSPWGDGATEPGA
ncbi:gamma-glutamyltransferase [Acidimangrovimonas sediminis]|uniref:gamma-glutamyltransferase n=1 Tax=Acidimangrovimonas sediminis TaxID=2056283 RepID=UPI000C80A162|nr:gamma-glutamyltransferase [Acidimangrovimonas sediminis]